MKTWFKKIMMMNKVIRDKSRCANCIPDKSRLLKQKYNGKSGWNNTNPKLLLKHIDILFEVQKWYR